MIRDLILLSKENKIKSDLILDLNLLHKDEKVEASDLAFENKDKNDLEENKKLESLHLSLLKIFQNNSINKLNLEVKIILLNKIIYYFLNFNF